MNQTLITIILFLVLFLIIWWIIRKNFKNLKVPSVCLITGGVKTGKSLLSVYLSIKDYKKRHRRWWLATHILQKDLEEPLYYTNVFITFGSSKRKHKHRLDRNICYISLDHLNRDIRFRYKSVIYIQECSLMADNMDFNNKERNIDLSLFNKLIAHETRGGAVYYDTQSVLDSHYSIKRVCSSYLFILRNLNLFLFHILYVREMINTENGVNNFDDDVELTMRKVIIPFWYHNKYDRYEYSYLTDELPTRNKDIPLHNGLVSFNNLYIERSDKRRKEKKK